MEKRWEPHALQLYAVQMSRRDILSIVLFFYNRSCLRARKYVLQKNNNNKRL